MKRGALSTCYSRYWANPALPSYIPACTVGISLEITSIHGSYLLEVLAKGTWLLISLLMSLRRYAYVKTALNMADARQCD